MGADLGSAVDDPSDGEAEAPVARKPVFPSSIGLSVLVRPECKSLSLRAMFGTYTPVPAKPGPSRTRDSAAPPARATSSDAPPAKPDTPSRASEPPDGEEASLRVHWRREPHSFTETLPLDGKTRFDVPLKDFEGVSLRVVLRKVPETEIGKVPETDIGLVPPGTRYATIFLVNDRKAYPDDPSRTVATSSRCASRSSAPRASCRGPTCAASARRTTSTSASATSTTATRSSMPSATGCPRGRA